jgi:hypothetical protein
MIHRSQVFGSGPACAGSERRHHPTPTLRRSDEAPLQAVAALILLLGLVSCPAADLKLDTLVVGDKVYSNVTVLGVSATDLSFSHSQGMSRVKLKDLDEKLQQKFDFNPRLAEQIERQELFQAIQRREIAASNQVAEANQAKLDSVRASNTLSRAAASSRESLADPVSDTSLLGKSLLAMEGKKEAKATADTETAGMTLEAFQVEKWLGAPPVLEGKGVLVLFWEPWSKPCLLRIAAWNDLQRTFANELTLVAITSASDADVKATEGTGIEFASAVDSKDRLRNLIGATSVPYALLMDPDGTIRYLGHPDPLLPVQFKGQISLNVLQSANPGAEPLTPVAATGSGKKHLTVLDKDDKVIFDGDIETAEQQQQVPGDIWTAVQPKISGLEAQGLVVRMLQIRKDESGAKPGL